MKTKEEMRVGRIMSTIGALFILVYLGWCFGLVYEYWDVALTIPERILVYKDAVIFALLPAILFTIVGFALDDDK